MASIQDADLILRLYEARREPVLRQARDWFLAHCEPRSVEELQALIPRGSDANRYFRMVTSYWEMTASFLVQGAVDEQLFLDNCGEGLLVWRRLGELVPTMRSQRHNPNFLRNLEEMVRRHAARRG